MADLLLQLKQRFASFYGRLGRMLFGSGGNSRFWPILFKKRGENLRDPFCGGPLPPDRIAIVDPGSI
jgi:hypothetical protein